MAVKFSCKDFRQLPFRPLYLATSRWCLCLRGSFRGWLHGEFQPGLKFRSAHRAEILLWLHAQIQPGRKTQISVRKFTEVRKHSQCACSRSFFGPGWNSVSITWDFFIFLGPFGRAENPSPVWEYRARIFSPGWIPLHVIDNLGFRVFVSEAGMKLQPG